MSSAPAIAIVGCGLAGAASGLALARLGAQVTMLERAPEVGPVGAGLLIHPSGVRALDALGLAEAALAGAEPVSELVAMHADGRPLSRLRYAAGRPGAQGYGVSRGRLFTVLHQAALGAGAELVTGAEVVGCERSDERVHLIDAAGRRHGPYALVVAADGSRSRLRALVPELGASVHEYAHAALWRVGSSTAVRGRLLQVVDGTRELLGLLPTGRGETSLFWGLELARLEPVRTAGFAAFTRRAAALSPAAGELLEAVTGFDGLTLATYRHVRLARWRARGVVVVGDAAHAMAPHLGQGANLALGDAVALATALSETAVECRGGDFAALSPSDLDLATCRYTAQRRRRVEFYAAMARLLAPFFQSNHRVAAPLRDLALPLGLRLPGVERLMARVLAG